jgi:hypothetical protein
MRKYVWTGLFVVIIVAAAGIVHARGGLIRSHATPGDSASTSTPSEKSSSCPLQCIMNFCGLGD